MASSTRNYELKHFCDSIDIIIDLSLDPRLLSHAEGAWGRGKIDLCHSTERHFDYVIGELQNVTVGILMVTITTLLHGYCSALKMASGK